MRAMGRKGTAARTRTAARTAARTAGRPRRGSILVASLALSVLGAAAVLAAGAQDGNAAPVTAAAKPAKLATTAMPAPGAKATLESADDPKLSGTVAFIQLADAVRIEINVAGADHPGLHGIHLHENGKCEHDPGGKHYTSAGGHFNPTAAPHACRESTTHHAGDFGNIEIQPDGTGHLVVVTSMLSLRGPNSPIGKAVILHTDADDCKTQPTGNSGGRLACGLVLAEGGMAH